MQRLSVSVRVELVACSEIISLDSAMVRSSLAIGLLQRVCVRVCVCLLRCTCLTVAMTVGESVVDAAN